MRRSGPPSIAIAIAIAIVVSLVAAPSARADERDTSASTRASDSEDERASAAPEPRSEIEARSRRAAPPQPQPGSHWQPHWPRFHWLEGVATVVAEGAAIAVYFWEPVRTPKWLAPAPLDSELRDALRLDSADDRRAAVIASDVLLYGMLPWPVLVDALLLAGAVHGDTDTMLQMTLIDLETLAVAHLATWLTSRLVGRARPSHLGCVADDSCPDRGSGPVASFVSGHALMAYATAGLVCTHHVMSPWLTGSSEGAGLFCAGALGVATASSALRILADKHWTSDVAIGGLIGATIGFGVPLVLHYGRPHRGPRASARAGATESADRARWTAPAPALLVAPAESDGPGLRVLGAF